MNLTPCPTCRTPVREHRTRTGIGVYHRDDTGPWLLAGPVAVAAPEGCAMPRWAVHECRNDENEESD